MTAPAPVRLIPPGAAVTTRLLTAAPLVLAMVAEGSWVAVVAALVQAASDQAVVLGPPALAATAGAGLLVARGAGARLGPERWPFLAVALTVVAAAVGWLADSSVREALGRADAGAVLGRHPGGWLAGLAFLRGTAHAQPIASEAVVGRLLSVAVPGLAVLFLVGGALAEPHRRAFAEAAFVANVVVVLAGTLALALARIARLGTTGGFDWRRNRAWLALLVVLVAAIVTIALPASFALGAPVRLLLALLPVPLLVAGLVAGLGQVSRRSIVSLVVLGVALLALSGLAGQGALAPIEIGGLTGAVDRSIDQPLLAVALWVLLLVVLALLVALLARLWMRQVAAPSDGDVAEERTIDVGIRDDGAARHARRRRPMRQGRPRTAAGAYVALLLEAERTPAARRAPEETPAEHAARLRLGAANAEADAGRSAAVVPGEPGPASPGGPVPGPPANPLSSPLALLAADYELIRFAGRLLAPPEHRRAIARWRRVRAASAAVRR